MAQANLKGGGMNFFIFLFILPSLLDNVRIWSKYKKLMDNKNKTILIVEDEKPMANALVLKLQKSGFSAKAVYDGLEALDELAKNKYDLILLDLILPKLNGFGVLEEMSKKKIKVPVIVASNLSQEDDMNRAKKLGAKGYFIKSNTPISQVVKYVSDALNQ